MRDSARTPDYTFLGLLAAVITVGLVALTSASGYASLQKAGNSWYFLRHQVVFGLVPGLALFLVAMRIDYRKWKSLAPHFLVASIALLFTVFIPGIRADWGTSRSWIHIGSFSFQPAELVKLTFLLYVAAWLERHKPEFTRGSLDGVAPFLIAFGTIAALIMLQPDLGSLLVIACIAFGAYFAAGARWSHIAILGALGSVGVWFMVKLQPYRFNRLMTFLHPELDPLNVGYHVNQAFLAVGSGGLFGLGLGHSVQKMHALPEVMGDSIFAVMSEELGLILILCFLALLLAFCWRLIRIAQEAPDDYGTYVATGIAAWVFSQALFNIGSMVGLMPLTGLPLPFVSYGGSSIIVLMAAMGVMANISMHGRLGGRQ